MMILGNLAKFHNPEFLKSFLVLLPGSFTSDSIHNSVPVAYYLSPLSNIPQNLPLY